MATTKPNPNLTPGAAATVVVTAAPVPTPENTPVPGGGRWRWDIAAPGWVNLDAPASAAPALTSTDATLE